MAELDQQTGNQAPTDWRTGISEENRSAVAKFTDVDGLAKGYSELQSAYSGTIKLPTDKSTPEDLSSFYNRCGRPDTSDGYTRPDLPEGKEYDADLIGGIQTAAFDAGITSKQFSSLVERYLAIETKRAETQAAETARVQEETDRGLRELWHADYDKNLEVARRAMRELVTDDLGEQFKVAIEESGLGNNSVFIQGFLEIGKKILNDSLVKSDSTGPVVADDFVPSHPQSPEMYRNGETDEDKKSRAYFEKRGHVY